jgi:hypothetical protein
MKYTGQVNEEGILKISNRKQFDADLKEFAGKYVFVEVTRKKSKRSDNQNRYYWSGVIPMVRLGLKDLGYKLSIEDTHLFLRNKFLLEEMVNGDGELIGSRVKSTTELNKMQFGDYISEIQQFSAEYLGVVIPDPETQTTLI